LSRVRPDIMRKTIISILVLFLAAGLAAQDELDKRFIKITHTADYTVGVDSAGDKWIYDYDLGKFVAEEEFVKNGVGGEEFGEEDVILPPEIRCTDVYHGDITDIFGQVEVDLDDRIEGSITSGKDVIVRGLVTGKVVSYRKVTVTATGEVRGDVMAREIVRERGGRILGQSTEVPFPEAIGIGMPQVRSVFPSFSGIIFTGFLIFVTVIAIALFPNHLRRIGARIEEGVVKTFFIGFLVWFAILPAFVLLVITIIGIPIAVLVFPFALMAAILLGYVAAVIYIGRRLSPIFGWQDKSTYVIGIIGVVAIAILRLLANFTMSIGADGLGTLLGLIYGLTAFVALTTGLGAVVSSKFGFPPKKSPDVPGGGPDRRRQPAVKPPPPPRVDPSPSFIPPPPKTPPPPKSENATDDGPGTSN